MSTILLPVFDIPIVIQFLISCLKILLLPPAFTMTPHCPTKVFSFFYYLGPFPDLSHFQSCPSKVFCQDSEFTPLWFSHPLSKASAHISMVEARTAPSPGSVFTATISATSACSYCCSLSGFSSPRGSP